MENIHILKPDELEKKKNEFKRDGKTGFHIVTDFDRTLTKAFVNGKSAPSTYYYVREGGYLAPGYSKKAFELFDKYHPLEISPELTREEKAGYMEEWWTTHHNLMLEAGFSIGVVKDIVDKDKIHLREGVDTFLDTLAEEGIPLLIFSAGSGNIIKDFLKIRGKATKNVHVISNFFIFDDSGKAVAYEKPLIHTFNKNESSIKGHPYKKEIEDRKNVILLGDSLGDLDMAAGIPHDCIIKIGFLNHDRDSLLKQYKESFDVVITEDGNMGYVNSLLKEILG